MARRGGGLLASIGEPELDRCTVAWNSGKGIASFGTATPIRVRNSIIWGNAGGSISSIGGQDGRSSVDVTNSCVEGGDDGNMAEDPLFCGWKRDTIFVDANAPPAGDGSETRPFRDLPIALDGEYSFALRLDSPCHGIGERGADIGADFGQCPRTSGELVIELAPGTYEAPSALGRNISLYGAGADETTLLGTVRLLSTTESILDALTVTGGLEGGVTVWTGSRGVRDADLELSDVVIRENDGPGVSIGGGDCFQPSVLRLIKCVVRDNWGPGVHSGGSGLGSIVLQRCTIAGNQPIRRELSFEVDACLGSMEHAGGVLAEGPVAMESSIVWENAGRAVTGAATATFSCIQDGYPGQGNIDLDPRFCGGPLGPEIDGDPEVLVDSPFDLSLRADSPCLGAGRDGVDMGAYEMGDCEEDAGVVRFLRGDCNGDGEVNLSDAVCVLEGLFLGDQTARCLAATNVNGDGTVDIADPVHILGHLFGGGPAPPGPFPECGPSTLEIDRELGCASSCE